MSLVGPTVPKLPHKIGTNLEPLDMYLYDVLTVIANLAGIPAASMPAGDVGWNSCWYFRFRENPKDDSKILEIMAKLE
jgi:aspartyl-tRNA(Asn)/glutamyl-tRNA(Gln) amidotransferase subunit A